MKRMLFVSVLLAVSILGFAQTAHFDVALTADSTGVVITGFSGTATTVTVPGNLEGLPVKAIGKGAFSGKSIRSITIPRGITVIESEAFAGTRTLATVNLPDTLQKIGDRAFSSTGLTSVKIPENCLAIGEGAFENCRTLRAVQLPDDLQVIPASMFLGCEAILKIDFPVSIREIKSKAFADCKVLAALNFPPSVTAITFASDVFIGCPKINLGTQVALKKMGYEGGF